MGNGTLSESAFMDYDTVNLIRVIVIHRISSNLSLISTRSEVAGTATRTSVIAAQGALGGNGGTTVQGMPTMTPNGVHLLTKCRVQLHSHTLMHHRGRQPIIVSLYCTWARRIAQYHAIRVLTIWMSIVVVHYTEAHISVSEVSNSEVAGTIGTSNPSCLHLATHTMY